MTHHTYKKKSRQNGFSLVEMMVAMVIGLMMIAGVVTVFSGGVRSSNFNTAMSNLQTGARYALDTIAVDVRMAGYQGCSNPQDVSLNVNASPAPTANFANTAITGATVGTTDWNPGKPANYTDPTAFGVPVVGTDVILIQYAQSPGFPITENMTSRSADIKVAAGTGRFPLINGDFALISDCNSSDLFQLDTVDTGTTVKTIVAEDALSKAYARSSATDTTVRVLPFINALYYIGDTGRDNPSGDNIYSLYRQSYPYNPTTNPPIEMVEGVDQMQVQFGIQQASGNIAFVKASDTNFSAEDVVSIRIGILMTSNSRFNEVNTARTFVLANTTVGSAAQAPVRYPADKRLRFAYSTTISVRNRSNGS